jgi:hypothetical protein
MEFNLDLDAIENDITNNLHHAQYFGGDELKILLVASYRKRWAELVVYRAARITVPQSKSLMDKLEWALAGLGWVFLPDD